MMKGIQKNGIASKGLVLPSEDRKEGEEIPVFISHGVKTINDLIQNLGLDNLINAEFLRKIKFGEESSSERELLEKVVSRYFTNTRTAPYFKVKDVSAHQLLVFLCCICANKDLWIERSLKQAFTSISEKHPHIIPPQAAACYTESLTSQPIESDREFSGEYLEAIICKYSLLRNKLKKLKELQKVHAKLIAENLELLQKLDPKQHNIAQIHENMIDGVDISPSISLQEPTAAIPKKFHHQNELKSTTLLTELPEFRNFEKQFENESSVEELFWRWISTPSGSSVGETPRPKPLQPVIFPAVDEEIEKWKSQILEIMKIIEIEVIQSLFKEKIDLFKVKSKLLSFLNTNNSSGSSDPLQSSFSSTSQQEGGMNNHDNLFLFNVIANLLNYSDLSLENISPSLLELREENFQHFQTLAEISTDSSPFYCVQRETSKTF